MEKTVWQISYELEAIAENRFHAKFGHSCTIFDRSEIEKDMFYDIMHLLLFLYGGDGTIDFLNKYCDLKRVNMNKIKNYQEIFEEFKELLVR